MGMGYRVFSGVQSRPGVTSSWQEGPVWPSPSHPPSLHFLGQGSPHPAMAPVHPQGLDLHPVTLTPGSAALGGAERRLHLTRPGPHHRARLGCPAPAPAPETGDAKGKPKLARTAQPRGTRREAAGPRGRESRRANCAGSKDIYTCMHACKLAYIHACIKM